MGYSDSPPPLGAKRAPAVLRFGDFELDRVTGRLTKQGSRAVLKLTGQAKDLLLLLLERPGELVTRQQVQERLWGPSVVVDFDASINTAIKKIRQILDDDAADPQFLETVPRQGYRFLGPVQYVMAPPSPKLAVTEESTPPPPEPEKPAPAETSPAVVAPDAKQGRPSRRIWLLWLASILVLTAVVVIVLMRIAPAPNDQTFHIEWLTKLPGDEYLPSFSPDGSRVVFCWGGYDDSTKNLWIKQVGGTALTRLTTKGRDEFPAWSPDGKWIAFVRSLKDVMLIPSLGGVERKIGETPGLYLSWTTDSSAVIVGTRRRNTFDTCDLDAIAIESGKRTRLTSAQDEVYGYQPYIPSPDGRLLGFTHRPAPGKEAEIYVRPMAGGQPTQLTRMGRHLREWTWTPDGREIIFGANPDGYFTLWRVRVDGRHAPQQIKLGVMNVQSPFMVPANVPRTSVAGSLLGFESWVRTANFHELRVEPAKAGRRMLVSGPTPLLGSSGEDHELDLSPDGQRAVFVSNRSGFQEVWLADGFAGNTTALTSLGRDNQFPYSPRWSNDGSRIVFEAQQGEGVPSFAEPGGDTSRILVLNVNGGAPQEVAANHALNVRPFWSRDDKWIYFGSRRSGTWQLWRVSTGAAQAAGAMSTSGAALQITTRGGFEAMESLDGKQLFYKRSPSDEDLWVMPIGAEGPLESGAARIRTGGVFAGWWVVGGDGIFFVDIANALQGPRAHPTSDPKPIYFLDPRTRAAVQLAAIDHHLLYYLADLAVSRDGRRLVYSEVDFHNIDLGMVRGFR